MILGYSMVQLIFGVLMVWGNEDEKEKTLNPMQCMGLGLIAGGVLGWFGWLLWALGRILGP